MRNLSCLLPSPNRCVSGPAAQGRLLSCVGGLLALFVVAVVSVGLPGRPAQASAPVVADLSDDMVRITTGFHGSKVVLFGATDGGGGDVVVIIRGPDRTVPVRRKDRLGVIWANVESHEFAGVPAYYAMAATRSVEDFVPEALRQEHQIGGDYIVLRPLTAVKAEEAKEAAAEATENSAEGEGAPDQADVSEMTPMDPQVKRKFQQAILRIKAEEGLYPPELGQIEFVDPQKRLFRTTFSFPANVPTGDYTVEVMLFRDGQLVGKTPTALTISKVGTEAAIFSFAYDWAAFYAIGAIFIAVAFGWGANYLFKKS